ncbi:Glutathionyl-hydroquinone reductase [Ascochyta rabiei]|nr:Glutathionyl-hydroquinone reductase [Ascochyta rabiei]UPX12526.1 Glutathionyl-hydroquinone reductase [Ascochyta rabiei]
MTASKLRPDQPLHQRNPCGGLPSKFRDTIPSEQFPAEKDRYVLYVNMVCPWAHRAVIVRALKGLEGIIQIVEVDARDTIHGWYFSGQRGPECDPTYGFRWLKELYLKADPSYTGRVTIPMLWDRQRGTIVNNESGDIMRILINAFDKLLPSEMREANKGPAALVPEHLQSEIDELNSWVYNTVNNGVYKIGFATSQAMYDEHIHKLFQSLDRLEDHLSEAKHQPYLFGKYITEADIRLYTTLIRFDVAYYPLFKCNIKMIRLDYPRLHTWLRRLYWHEGPETAYGAFKKSTRFDVIKHGYAAVTVGNGVVPAGPVPPIMPL